MEKSANSMSPPIAISLWGRCLSSFDFGDEWPFPHLLRDSGLNVVPIATNSAEFYVAIDHFRKPLKLVEQRIPVQRRLLFALEPRAVNPAQYTAKVRNRYGTTVVQSLRQKVADSDMVRKFGPLGTEAISLKADKLHKVGLVNENKFSFVAGNLYKTRIKYILELAKSGLEVQLAGKNWDKGLVWHFKHQLFSLGVCVLAGVGVQIRSITFPLRKNRNIHLAGRVPSSIDFLAQCEFALVIENDPDYVSEKLFNAVEAGCVPLYLGPPLAEFGIPSEIAIALNGTRNDASNAILCLPSSVKSQILEAGHAWILSERTRKEWAHLTALKGMVTEINSMIETKHP